KAPALYFADEFEIVPRIDDSNYIKALLEISKRHEISAIISLIDPELELLANNREKFEEHQIELILSPAKYIDMSFDKFKTYKYLSTKEIQSVPTYQSLEQVKLMLEDNEMRFPLIVKPSKGSASLGLFIV